MFIFEMDGPDSPLQATRDRVSSYLLSNIYRVTIYISREFLWIAFDHWSLPDPVTHRRPDQFYVAQDRAEAAVALPDPGDRLRRSGG